MFDFLSFRRMNVGIRRQILSMTGLKFVAVLLALMSVPSTAIAEGVVASTPIWLVGVQGGGNYNGHDGTFFVVFQTAVGGQSPSCATNNTRFAVDAGSDDGKAMIALLMTAFAQKKPVTIYGASICNIWPDTETIHGVNVIE